MTFNTRWKLLVHSRVVRLEMTGLAGRYPLMLALVAIDTQQQAMLGHGLTQLLSRPRVTSHTMLGLKGI